MENTFKLDLSLISADPRLSELRKQNLELFQSRPEEFWKYQAKRIDWFRFPEKIKNVSFKPPVSIKWYEDGQLNISYNCLDRHLKTKAEQPALIWEPDHSAQCSVTWTYSKLHREVCAIATSFKKSE